MGNRNVEKVLLARPPIMLPRAAVYCLCLMAKAAHDDEQKYWAGHDWLALQMGYGVSPGGRRLIRRHMAELAEAGYVKATDERRQGRTVYQLSLPGWEDHIGPIPG